MPSREMYWSNKIPEDFCIYLKSHLKYVKEWWDHHSVSEIKRQRWICCYYKGAVLGSGKISKQSKILILYWVLGKCGFQGLADVQKLESVDVICGSVITWMWLLLFGWRSIYWTEFDANWYFRSKDCHWLASVYNTFNKTNCLLIEWI